MPIDYSRLGQNEEMQKRRYDVLTYWVKGATPADTAEGLKIDIADVYNDFRFISKSDLHDISPEIARGFNQSFYEIKIRELEGSLKRLKADIKAWLTLQDLIRRYKLDSLRLQGLLTDKVEHSGTVKMEISLDDAIKEYETVLKELAEQD